jgi:diguanylate cyclase (GGDEF)-like protein
MKMEYQVSDSPALLEQSEENFRHASANLARRVDRKIAWLLAVEWPCLVAIALVWCPLTWDGTHSRINPHLAAAILAGPAFILPAIFCAWRFPGGACKHILAAAQILVSILLIDVTNGRIESHFHIFGSLAILAFYRDWRVLVTAFALTMIDHVFRGLWFPYSVYGVLAVSPMRWVEHGLWVIFEDFFLILNSTNSIKEMRLVAMREAQLSWGAFHDVLTGLPNRRALQECFDLSRVKSECPNRAVLYLDLDHFRRANDTLGHATGDELLKMVAARLDRARDPRMMVARVGGDEFVAFLDRFESPLAARDQAARLLSVLAEPFEVRGHRLLLSASIGIALFPEHGIELRELQERADRAMYAAKAQGRNQAVVFSTGVARRELLMQEITRDLPQALTRNQMKLWFQPVVRRNGTLSGFEALVRWIHPLHGSIPPADFIPLVERSGDSAVLDEWVLHEACRRCARWNERGRRLGVAVNVSAGQIEQPDFALRVLRILDRTGLDPVLLTIELTERSLVQDKSAARQQLADLRRYGVHVALDDFGTGYSSLSYLTTLPVDTIKLDRSFLSRDGETTAAVVEAVIEMAHRIGLSVIAEGVETIDQVERLRRLECDEMQGFYYSPPIPWGDVEGYVDVKSSARVWQPEEYCVPA